MKLFKESKIIELEKPKSSNAMVLNTFILFSFVSIPMEYIVIPC